MGSGTAHQLQKHLIDYTASLFNEGILNEQFTQLQSLQDESNPDFVGEVVNLFFEDSERLLNEMAKSLGQGNVDFKKLDAHVHQLKGSSSRCVKCLQQVRNEYSLVKSKLETMFKLEQQILAAGASIPKVVSGF
ncbi:histidine-containing phosphotransfer protein 1-like isoform X2 [Silene latifolia]|uniref:histidine-containing phosphotransfer protein 1-like isoform X2 n=1 Tax=Silene latifolia TaxID=37657 RepID=UPI003D77A189